MPAQHEVARARWNQNDAAFRALVASGASASEAGAALGVTKNAAIGRAHRMGLIWARSPEPAAEPLVRSVPISIWPPPGRCVWPNDLYPGDNGFGFCGEPKVEIGVYCAEHRAMAYLPPKKQKLRPLVLRA